MLNDLNYSIFQNKFTKYGIYLKAIHPPFFIHNFSFYIFHLCFRNLTSQKAKIKEKTTLFAQGGLR
jgi:hypothetical protein